MKLATLAAVAALVTSAAQAAPSYTFTLVPTDGTTGGVGELSWCCGYDSPYPQNGTVNLMGPNIYGDIGQPQSSLTVGRVWASIGYTSGASNGIYTYRRIAATFADGALVGLDLSVTIDDYPFFGGVVITGDTYTTLQGSSRGVFGAPPVITESAGSVVFASVSAAPTLGNPVSAVPEVSTYLLMFLGMTAFGLTQRRLT